MTKADKNDSQTLRSSMRNSRKSDKMDDRRDASLDLLRVGNPGAAADTLLPNYGTH